MVYSHPYVRLEAFWVGLGGVCLCNGWGCLLLGGYLVDLSQAGLCRGCFLCDVQLFLPE